MRDEFSGWPTTALLYQTLAKKKRTWICRLFCINHKCKRLQNTAGRSCLRLFGLKTQFFPIPTCSMCRAIFIYGTYQSHLYIFTRAVIWAFVVFFWTQGPSSSGFSKHRLRMSEAYSYRVTCRSYFLLTGTCCMPHTSSVFTIASI